LIGTYVLSAGYFDAYYMKALKVRKIIHHEFNDVFQKVDALLTPTTPSSAFCLDNEPKDPVTMYLNDVLTVTANIVGIPGMSVPICLDKDQKPLGLQLMAPRFMEEKLIQIGSVLEAGANFPSLKEID
jgi:aspartyl-tRNA(Asn)/glutamyl-tRNA(Gln) amidotransferase subunit A